MMVVWEQEVIEQCVAKYGSCQRKSMGAYQGCRSANNLCKTGSETLTDVLDNTQFPRMKGYEQVPKGQSPLPPPESLA